MASGSFHFAHASLPVIKHFLSKFQPKLSLKGISSIDFCDVCVRTKLTHKAHDQIRAQPTRPAEIIHTDITGPIIPLAVPNSYKFVLAMVDGYTKYAREHFY